MSVNRDHTRELRNTKIDLAVPLMRTVSGQKAFSYRGTKVWNKFNNDIKEAPSVYSFKSIGYYPSFTLPRFTSDLTKGLSHNLTVQYHEAIATLRNQICIIMRDHHRVLQQEEDARITALTNNLNGIYEPNIVRIIIDNAKRTASNKNRKGNRQ